MENNSGSRAWGPSTNFKANFFTKSVYIFVSPFPVLLLFVVAGVRSSWRLDMFLLSSFYAFG